MFSSLELPIMAPLNTMEYDPKDEAEIMSRNPSELMTLPLQEFWRMPKEVLGVKPSCVPETGGSGRE